MYYYFQTKYRKSHGYSQHLARRISGMTGLNQGEDDINIFKVITSIIGIL